jgi:hypothetical protein
MGKEAYSRGAPLKTKERAEKAIRRPRLGQVCGGTCIWRGAGVAVGPHSDLQGAVVPWTSLRRPATVDQIGCRRIAGWGSTVEPSWVSQQLGAGCRLARFLVAGAGCRVSQLLQLLGAGCRLARFLVAGAGCRVSQLLQLLGAGCRLARFLVAAAGC